jgi:hypothetical protein
MKIQSFALVLTAILVSTALTVAFDTDLSEAKVSQGNSNSQNQVNNAESNNNQADIYEENIDTNLQRNTAEDIDSDVDQSTDKTVFQGNDVRNSDDDVDARNHLETTLENDIRGTR